MDKENLAKYEQVLSEMKRFERKMKNLRDEEKEIKCPFCLIDFKLRNWGLKIHIIQNHGDIYAKIKAEKTKTSLQCQICQRVFQEKRFLAVHTKEKHGEIFNSSCNHTTLCNCDKNENTIEKEVLKESFQCDICEREYSQKSILERHIKTTHETQEFQCNICDMTFPYQHHLKV